MLLLHLMKRIVLVVIFSILCPAYILRAQSMDSVLLKLFTRQDYFQPEDVDLSRTDLRDSSSYELINYLNEGVKTPTRSLAYISTRLGLPLVVREVEPVNLLSIEAPSLSLSQPKSNFPQIDDYIRRRKIAYQLGLLVAQHIQSRNISRSIYTERAFHVGRELLEKKENHIDAQALLGNELQPKSIKHYVESFDVADIERKYWIPSFESSVQFSQNYISDNWHKGGNSNLNLSMRTYFSLLYNKERLQWLNEIESKLGLYTATSDGDESKYRISEDRLRLHSNFGIKMSKRWSYTLDGEFRTQLFNIYSANNQVLQSSLFAPIRTNLGVGVQYNYSKKSKVRYGRKFALSLNFAPFSHNWRWSSKKNIDLARHGLKTDKLSVHTFGSTFRAELNWDFNMDISWRSRMYFNTSYKSVEAEWENTLVMRISRYFSTRLNIHLRFDDTAKPSPRWNKYLQINEVLSFGFNYKL